MILHWKCSKIYKASTVDRILIVPFRWSNPEKISASAQAEFSQRRNNQQQSLAKRLKVIVAEELFLLPYEIIRDCACLRISNYNINYIRNTENKWKAQFKLTMYFAIKQTTANKYFMILRGFLVAQFVFSVWEISRRKGIFFNKSHCLRFYYFYVPAFENQLRQFNVFFSSVLTYFVFMYTLKCSLEHFGGYDAPNKNTQMSNVDDFKDGAQVLLMFNWYEKIKLSMSWTVWENT